MDTRSRREKLQAMANQSVSPQEAAIAKTKLSEMEPSGPPKRPIIYTYPHPDIMSHKIKIKFSFDGGKTYQEAEYDALNSPIFDFKINYEEF